MSKTQAKKQAAKFFNENKELLAALASSSNFAGFKKPGQPTGQHFATIKGNGLDVDVSFEHTEIKTGINTPELYDFIHHDSDGDYRFLIEPCDDKNILLSVQGGLPARTKMDKKRCIWEFDMIWGSNPPLILVS